MAANEDHFYLGTPPPSHLTLTSPGFVSHAAQGESKRDISVRCRVDSKIVADFAALSHLPGKE